MTNESAPFTDRHDAGRRLAEKLNGVDDTNLVVVGIARGGVPVASEVARSLKTPLEVIVVRKIGAPGNPEYGIGAVAEDGISVLDRGAVAALHLDRAKLVALVSRARQELAQRVERYGSRARYPVRDRSVLLVDDGLATGHTARAAARALRERGARKVVLAVPVAARGSAHALLDDVDELICVQMPYQLGAIGLWYEDFHPPSDEQLEKLLTLNRRNPNGSL